MSESRSGGCQCGEIRYEITGDPVALIACHCQECQRQSGSAFGMSLIFPIDGFRLTTGQPKSFTRSSDSGRPVECSFCPSCGTRVFHTPSSMPGTLNVKPGTLDDTSWLEPAAHVWTRRKQTWVDIPDGTPCFDEQPELGKPAPAKA